MDKLTAQQLRDRIGATEAALAALIKAGLPCEGPPDDPTFSAEAVDGWLLENGLAEIEGHHQDGDGPEVIARTRAEAAQLLGLSGVDGSRTISRWAQLPGFPGRSGSPGKRDGYYPIEQIRQWRAEQFSSAGPRLMIDDPAFQKLDHNRREMLIEVQRKELQDHVARFADVAEIARFNRHVVTAATEVLAQLVDQIMALLPATLSEGTRSEVRAMIIRIHSNAMLAIEEITQGDPDATTDVDEPEAV